MGSPRRPGLEAALAGIAFFLSGAAALVYQVSWPRILALHSGVGIYSIAIIVAAFMAGADDARKLLEEFRPLNLRARTRRQRELNLDLFPRDEFRSPGG